MGTGKLIRQNILLYELEASRSKSTAVQLCYGATVLLYYGSSLSNQGMGAYRALTQDVC